MIDTLGLFVVVWYTSEAHSFSLGLLCWSDGYMMRVCLLLVYQVTAMANLDSLVMIQWPI